MEVTIKELLEGKSTLIKNKEFFPTKQYVEPFLDRMSSITTDFTVQVKLPTQMTTQQHNADITYNRVLVQARLPKEYSIEDHNEVVGFLYGLDVRKPVVKIYRGYENSACTNLTVFNPMWIQMQELIPGEPINFSGIKGLIEQTSNFGVKLKEAKNTFVDRSDKTNLLGQWVDHALRAGEDFGFGKVKIAVSTPIDAYKKIFINQDSPYFIPEGMDPSLYDVYNAFTQVVTDDKKDILNKFEKTIIIGKLLGVINE